jgi:hypothetical protein
MHADLASKCLFALRIFLFETNARWFWRGTDDVIVNWNRLPHLIANCSGTHVAERDSVVLGHCIPSTRGVLQESERLPCLESPLRGTFFCL